MENTGLTYYKLISDYRGDYPPKNCGLTTTEVDGNFYFLRGNDIDGFIKDEETGKISLKRTNNEIIDIPEDIYSFDYDEDLGVLTITSPSGKFIELSGFYHEGKEKVYSDSSLIGDGTKISPLKINGLEKTGTLSSCKHVVDFTNGEHLPENPSFGDRYIVKEEINELGILYNSNGIKKIAQYLKDGNSEWRIPSREDWDNMLNAIECEEDRNHNSTSCNKWAGKLAGKLLKSNNYWQFDANGEDESGYDFKGVNLNHFNIIPTGARWDLDKTDVDGIGTSAIFWTSSAENQDDSADIFVKQFKSDSNKVSTSSKGPEDFFSLRLVKDFDNNYHDVENICGITVPCSLMADSRQVWTSVNFPLTVDDGDYVVSEKWNDLFPGIINTVYYFVAQFDGQGWKKRAINEGDGVVIENHDNKKYHEWRVIDRTLTDVSQVIVGSVATGVDGPILSFNKTNGIISADLTIRYDNETKTINLVNRLNNKAVGSIETSQFASDKDIFLDKGELLFVKEKEGKYVYGENDTEAEGISAEGYYLRLTWNSTSGKDSQYISLSAFATTEELKDLKKKVNALPKSQTIINVDENDAIISCSKTEDTYSLSSKPAFINDFNALKEKTSKYEDTISKLQDEIAALKSKMEQLNDLTPKLEELTQKVNTLDEQVKSFETLKATTESNQNWIKGFNVSGVEKQTKVQGIGNKWTIGIADDFTLQSKINA